jgi:hypothetical protein
MNPREKSVMRRKAIYTDHQPSLSDFDAASAALNKNKNESIIVEKLARFVSNKVASLKCQVH